MDYIFFPRAPQGGTSSVSSSGTTVGPHTGAFRGMGPSTQPASSAQTGPAGSETSSPPGWVSMPFSCSVCRLCLRFAQGIVLHADSAGFIPAHPPCRGLHRCRLQAAPLALWGMFLPPQMPPWATSPPAGKSDIRLASIRFFIRLFHSVLFLFGPFRGLCSPYGSGWDSHSISRLRAAWAVSSGGSRAKNSSRGRQSALSPILLTPSQPMAAAPCPAAAHGPVRSFKKLASIPAQVV